jgi:hypothetical protein
MAISVLASLATAISAAIAADATVRAFVTAIYNAHKGGGRGVSLIIRRYFEPGLAELIIRDKKSCCRGRDAHC